jgi:diaminopimelate decarboxylase
VTSVKTNVSTWVAVDGGMSDNLRPMLYAARYEAAIADRVLPRSDTPVTTVRLAGLHCESGDVLIDAVDLPDPAAGDLVAVPTTGAYTFSTANTYNGTPRAPVVFVGDGESRVVVRRETIEELGARDVE